MKKSLDILPPQPKPQIHHHTGEKKKMSQRSKTAFWTIFLSGVAILLIFSFMRYEAQDNPKFTTSSQKSDSNSFELFNDEGQSNLTSDPSQISVRIMNGTSNEDFSREASDLILKAGFKIEKKVNSANPYDQTIIYYKKDYQTQAENIQQVLKNQFNPTVEESTTLEESYSILVIIGLNSSQ